jgi:histidinol-phosphate phosphatase family protein
VDNGIVFLDRDGTINVDFGYVKNPAEVTLLPGVASALSQLRTAGFSLVVVTNQSAIGRGIASVQDVEATNVEVGRQLASEDARAVIDHWLYCPHAPEDACDCRKPKIGLLRSLRGGYKAGSCWMVGDKWSDIQFGINAGLPPEHCVLLTTTAEPLDDARIRRAGSLSEAAKMILGR